MIRIRQIRIPVFAKQDLEEKIADALNISKEDIVDFEINHQSIDARKKPNLYYVYEIDVNVKNEDQILKKVESKDIFAIEKKEYNPVFNGQEIIKHRPVIVGAGPSGLFCAYMLAKYGLKPIVIEQGMPMEDRIKSVNEFFLNGKLDERTNIQFGEGGAGTFSDGKLNTNSKDSSGLQKEVLKIFVKCGAPKEIMYINKPHIGTDILQSVIVNLRNEIISYGGEFRFNSKLNDVKINNNLVTSISINDINMDVSVLVLAIGHSARSTFRLLNEKNINMVSKPFAIGLRVQHLQKDIDLNQYGVSSEKLPRADYKLTFNNGERGVYSFCMCPGGYVVNASSEPNKLVINGMSNHMRDSENANSAIVVTVTPNDYGLGLFDGIKFQENLEQKAYQLCDGKIPTQLYGDFKNNITSHSFGKIKPVVKGSYAYANIREILPSFISDNFILGMDYFGKKIKGFNDKDVLVMGVESRTSSPIRIIRDEDYTSNVSNLYPIGEGAGYAGGIMTSAIDGIKAAEKILNKYKL